MFGASDGLVTNVSLILGVAGAHPSGTFVRLAGIAGLVAGAFSMAAGEYISMAAQRELLERELEVEREALRRSPEEERAELRAIYQQRGIEAEVAENIAAKLMADPDLALATHAREELGISPASLGAPLQAAGSSFATFGFGALLPLLPWLFASGTPAIVASIVIGVLAALGLGALVGLLAQRSWLRAALRQLLISVLAAGVTFGVGRAIGVNVH